MKHWLNSLMNSASIYGTEKDYIGWRKRKLDGYLFSANDCMVEISDPHQLSQGERVKIADIVNRNNFFFYHYHDNKQNHDGYQSICKQLGLTDKIGNPGANADQVTVVSQISQDAVHRKYIPYSDKPLRWHTDGYYNDVSDMVRGFILHCDQRAQTGGDNAFLDPEVLYIQLKDKDPDWITALEQPTCFTIPENKEGSVEIRPAFTGPVFHHDMYSHSLYTRYTERRRHISWCEDENTKSALQFIRESLASENPWATTVTLQPGQGVICNNVLHCRNAFTDDQAKPRKLNRIRFNNRISII